MLYCTRRPRVSLSFLLVFRVTLTLTVYFLVLQVLSQGPGNGVSDSHMATAPFLLLLHIVLSEKPKARYLNIRPL